MTDTDGARWQAVVANDPAADGLFLYAVRTTGVFCRPSCPSRRPKRENVSFFDTPDDATRAGYRPCRKCRPHEFENATVALVRRVCEKIDTAEKSPPLADLAAAVGTSPAALRRHFRAVLGVTPRAYAVARRAGRLKTTLRSAPTVAAAMIHAGYDSASRGYADAADHLGMSPAEFRDGGRDRPVRYALADCDLGRVGVAASDRGVCLVELGDEDDAIAAVIRGHFPEAEPAAAGGDFARLVGRVLHALAVPAEAATLPLDIRGTAFQRLVWEKLREVPPDATTTYGALAAAIGRPTAARAVGTAVGKNPVAVAIPCHRVVRSDGGLGGFRWGLERKRALLEREENTRTS